MKHFKTIIIPEKITRLKLLFTLSCVNYLEYVGRAVHVNPLRLVAITGGGNSSDESPFSDAVAVEVEESPFGLDVPSGTSLCPGAVASGAGLSGESSSSGSIVFSMTEQFFTYNASDKKK